MDLYTSTSYQLSEQLTKRYSTSFSMSSRLFMADTRRHIYAVYGLVRIADEIVDAYDGNDQEARLNELEAEVTRARTAGYSTNPIVHSFAVTAGEFGIEDDLVGPFFASMRMDLSKKTYSLEEYETYIYGSAEVIGLMCLKIFTKGNVDEYAALSDGARALGSAYQKVNFLRDMKADYNELGRVYFPGVGYSSFSEQDKASIIADIEREFALAKDYIDRLPSSARAAVRASYYYYSTLLQQLKVLPASSIVSRRIRVANWRKILLLLRARFGV